MILKYVNEENKNAVSSHVYIIFQFALCDPISYLILTMGQSAIQSRASSSSADGKNGARGFQKFPREMKTCLGTRSIKLWMVMSMRVLIIEQTSFRCLFLSVPVLRTLDIISLGSRNDPTKYVILSVNRGSASLSNLLKVTLLRIHAFNLNLIMWK